MDEHLKRAVDDRLMGVRLSQEFKQDPLYKLIEKTDLIDDLFDDYIEDLKESVEYTTSDFEEWYCTNEQVPNFLCKPSTMRSWQKQLNRYIEARMSGRTVLMDYQAVFRLKMALLLRKHQNVKLNRCAELVGIVHSENIHVLDREEDDDRKPGKENGLMDPFSGATEEQMQMISNWISAVVDKRMEEKMQLMLPGESHLNEMQEKIDKLAESLTVIQNNVTNEKQQEIVELAVNQLRQDVETRDKVLMEQLNKIKDDKQVRNEVKQEIISSLPFFVRWFVKK